MIIMKCEKCNHEQKINYGKWNCVVCHKNNIYDILDILKTMDNSQLRIVKNTINILLKQNMVI